MCVLFLRTENSFLKLGEVLPIFFPPRIVLPIHGDLL